MISLPIGSVLMAGVLVYVVAGMDYRVLLNLHSIILVFVGTVAVLAMSTPRAEIRGLFIAIRNIGRREHDEKELDQTLIDLSQKRDADLKVRHPLLVYARDLWEQGVEKDVFHSMLAQRLEDVNYMTEEPVASLRNLAKYPPALGMTGTVVGLVELFSNLTPDSKSSIGPSLALAMTATFYGLILANAILLPLADRLFVIHLKRSKRNEQIYQVLLMINNDEPTSLIQEELSEVAA